MLLAERLRQANKLAYLASDYQVIVEASLKLIEDADARWTALGPDWTGEDEELTMRIQPLDVWVCIWIVLGAHMPWGRITEGMRRCLYDVKPKSREDRLADYSSRLRNASGSQVNKPYLPVAPLEAARTKVTDNRQALVAGGVQVTRIRGMAGGSLYGASPR